MDTEIQTCVKSRITKSNLPITKGKDQVLKFHSHAGLISWQIWMMHCSSHDGGGATQIVKGMVAAWATLGVMPYLTYSPCTHAITSTYNLSPSSLSLLHLPHHKEVLTAMISQWRKGNMQSTLHSLKKTVVDANRAASTKMVHKVYPVVTKLTSCVNKIVDTQLMAITVSSWVVI